jgi:hypothetical protein
VAALFLLPTLAAGGALAHGGGLAGSSSEPLTVPLWLFLSTGGAVVAASFLLASSVTDRRLVRRFHEASRALPSGATALERVGQTVGLLGLALVLVVGAVGPADPLRSAAVLLVWAGWWAGYTMTTYLVGNGWPALNPFRTLAAPFGDGLRTYPERLGSWPAAVGLLALVWVEVVSPLADDPRALALAVGGYGVLTLAGAAVFGREDWFAHADPMSRVFAAYGAVAPVQRDEDGFRLVLPGAELVRDPAADASAVALVVALVWGTTYDGLVGTPLWRSVATTLVGAGVPAMALYPAVLGLGFLVFLGAFRLAARAVRPVAPTYLSAAALARAFAPSLLPIAAGYHLAHYLDYFLSLTPALAAALRSPLAPPAPRLLVLPDWFGGLSVAFVLLGHLLAVWVAHGVAYDRLPSRLAAVRSQYPITLAMVLYTMVSLWIVTRPSVTPPFLL